jgi:hypothetical protein
VRGGRLFKTGCVFEGMKAILIEKIAEPMKTTRGMDVNRLQRLA